MTVHNSYQVAFLTMRQPLHLKEWIRLCKLFAQRNVSSIDLFKRPIHQQGRFFNR